MGGNPNKTMCRLVRATTAGGIPTHHSLAGSSRRRLSGKNDHYAGYARNSTSPTFSQAWARKSSNTYKPATTDGKDKKPSGSSTSSSSFDGSSGKYGNSVKYSGKTRD